MSSFEDAIETDAEGLINVLETGRQIWEPAELVSWLKEPQRRWSGQSPLALIAANRSDEVQDVIDGLEVM
jgi:hypothetical protein